MKSLSTLFGPRNIAAAVEDQLREMFGGPGAVSDASAVLVHGSFLDQESWSREGRLSDIDLLVIQPDLSKELLAAIYRSLRALDLPGGSVRLDTRVGPLEVADGTPDGAIVVQAAVCSSYDDLSPATLQMLAYGAKAIVGSLPDANRLRRYDFVALQKWLECDVTDIAAIVVDNMIPYWTLSDDPAPRRIRALQVPRTASEQAKARRHAKAKLHSWSLLALSHGERLCDMGPGEMVALAGAIEDRNLFEATLAGFLGQRSGG